MGVGGRVVRVGYWEGGQLSGCNVNLKKKKKGMCVGWWQCTPLIPAPGRGGQVSECQDSQDYTEKHCLKNQTNKQTKNVCLASLLTVKL